MQRATPDSTFSLEELRLASGRRRRAAANAQLNGGVKAADATHNFFWWESYHSKMKTKAWRWTKDAAESMDERFTVTRHNVDPAAMLRGSNWLLRTHDSLWPLFMAILWVLATVLRRPESIARGYSPIVLETTTMLLHVILLETSHLGWGYSDQASCQLGDGGAAEDSRASIAALTRRSAATAPAISVLCGSLTTATVSTTGAGGLSGGGSRGAPIGRPPLYYSFYSRTAFVVEQSVWFLFAWVLLDPSLSQRVVVAVFFGLGVRWALFGFEGILCALCLTYLARRFSLMPTAVREELLHLPAQEGLIQRFYCAYSFSLAMTLLLSELDLFGDTRSKIVELFLGIPARITRWCHGYGFLQSAASWCFPFSRDQLPFEQVLYGCMGVALWYSFMVLEYTMEISILGLIGLLLTLPLLLGNFGGIRHFWRLCRDGAVRAGIYVAMLVLLKYAELPPSAMGLLANTMRTTAIALYLASRCDRRGEYPAAFALVWLVLVGLDAAMWSGKSFYGDLTTTTNAPLHLWRTSAVPLSSLTVESTTLDDLHALHMLCRWSTLVLHYNTVILGCMYLSTSTMRVLMNDVLVQLFYTTVTVLPSSSVMKAPVKASNASTTPTTNGLATSTRSAISAPRTTTSASGASANPSTSVAGAKASAERRQETAKAPKAAPPAASRQPPPSSSSSPPLSSPASMEHMARSQPEVCEEASLTATPVADRSEPLPCGTTCAVVKDLSQELASQLQHASTSNSAPEGILSGSCCSDGDVGRIAHSTDGSSRSSNLSLQAVPSNPTEPHAQTDAVVATLPHTPTECICSGSEGDHKPASSDGADEVVLREPTTINTPPSSLPEPLTAINSATAAPSRKKKAKDAPFHFVEDGKAKQHKAKKKEAAPPPPPVVAAVEREVPPANMAPTVREQRSHVVVKQTSPGAHREIPSVMAVRSALAPSINNAAGGAAKSFSAVVRGEVPTEAAERPAAPLPPPPPPPPLPPPPSSWMSPHRVPLPRSAQQRGTSHSNLGGAYVPYEEQVSMQRPPSPPLRSLPQPTSITPLELLSALMHPSTDSESPARDGTTGAVPYTGGGRQRSTSPSDVQWMLQELLRAPGSSRGGSSPAPHDDVDSVGEGAEQFDFRGVLPSSEEDEPTQQQPPASSLLLDGFSRGGTGHFGAFSQSMTGESGYLANVRRSSGGQEMGPSIFTSMRTEYGRPSVGADPAAWWPLQPGDDASTMPPPTDSPETSRSSLALPVMPNNVVSPQQTALSPPPYPRTPPSATSHPVEGGSYAFSTATGPMMPNMPNVMAPPVFTTSPGMLMSSVPSSYQIIPAQVAQTPMVLVPMTAVYPMMYGNTASPPTQLPVAPYWQQTTETQGGWAASNGEGLEPRSRPSS